jgi:periplasmic protein TonB
LNIAIKNSTLNESTLIWAVICSILLHILFFVVVPNFKFDVVKKLPDQLTVEIVQPKPPEPVVIPEPPKPVDQIVPAPEPIKPLPKKELRPEPTPVQDIKPEPIQAEPPPPPNVITAAPKVDAPPAITVPPPEPEPPKKIEPSEEDISAALSQYGNTLGRAIAKHKSYPKIAQMRGWQGDVILDLKLDGSGNIISVNIKENSGYESLDNQAIEMARKAAPYPMPPEALRGRSFNLSVPVSFKLENP